jgi:hypothetical protein
VNPPRWQIRRAPASTPLVHSVMSESLAYEALPLADRQSLTIPSQDPDYGHLGQAFPPWPGPATDAILQPPKPEITPSPQVLQRAADRDAHREAAD